MSKVTRVVALSVLVAVGALVSFAFLGARIGTDGLFTWAWRIAVLAFLYDIAAGVRAKNRDQ